MHVTIHTAKTQLSKLIEAALAGEDVVISKGSTPVVRLIPIEKKPFRVGLLKQELSESVPDFLAPSDEDDLAAWEGQ